MPHINELCSLSPVQFFFLAQVGKIVREKTKTIRQQIMLRQFRATYYESLAGQANSSSPHRAHEKSFLFTATV